MRAKLIEGLASGKVKKPNKDKRPANESFGGDQESVEDEIGQINDHQRVDNILRLDVLYEHVGHVNELQE